MTKLIMLFLFLFFILIPFIQANSVGVVGDYVKINEWKEINRIEGDEFKVSLFIHFYPLEKISTSEYIRNITFYYNPGLKNWSRTIKDIDIRICKGSAGKGHNYDKFSIDCNERLPIEIMTPSVYYHDYSITFDKKYLDPTEGYNLRIDYTIPKFFRDDKANKIIILDLYCTPQGGDTCPSGLAIEKHIVLPPYTSLIGFPENAKLLERSDGTTVITVDDFTYPGTKYQYANKVITYLDVQEQNRNQIKGFAYGILITLIIEILLLSRKVKIFIKSFFGL